eukprot:GHVP01033875.1.p1 GENE.GHVP01033875.1~~GHVP01033875.1.p1  ORF type:complete len:229 (+),score=42.01 GHVP01033875.1:24-689(+)
MDPKSEVKAGLAGAFLAVVSGGSSNSTAFESCEAHCHSPSENVSSDVYQVWGVDRNGNCAKGPPSPLKKTYHVDRNGDWVMGLPPPLSDEQNDVPETKEESHGPAGEDISSNSSSRGDFGFKNCSGCDSCAGLWKDIWGRLKDERASYDFQGYDQKNEFRTFEAKSDLCKEWPEKISIKSENGKATIKLKFHGREETVYVFYGTDYFPAAKSMIEAWKKQE